MLFTDGGGCLCSLSLRDVQLTITYPATEALQVDPVEVENLLTSLRSVVVGPPRAVRRGIGGVRQAGLGAVSGLEGKGGSRSQAEELRHDGGSGQLLEHGNCHVGQ